MFGRSVGGKRWGVRGVRGWGMEYRRQNVAAEQWEGSAGEVSGGRMLGWSTRGGVLKM
ncbi:hypothetical protein [Bartonella rattaustraliani]|uniref:hypothetical protein n=1 Tax=Bartonella rattaustraliani TaxID=481139 RepID=UPI000360FEC4|nr:hypothetical protein [Bartonella rattaustraliani]